MYGVRKSLISLEEYWEYLQINECAGYGIRRYPTTGVTGLGCGDYWNQDNRFFLSAALEKSEQRLEADRWLGFPIRRKYYGTSQLEYAFPAYLGKYTRGVGVETESLIESVNFDLSTGGIVNDPVEFTVTTSVSDIDEIIIKYPTTYFSSSCQDYTIRPSCIVISGGVATITIPRCRLLHPDYFLNYKNENERPDYTNDDYFIDTVDVYRNYLDTTTGANLVWWDREGSQSCFNNLSTTIPYCGDVTQTACAYNIRERDGFIQFKPAEYSSGTWSEKNYSIQRAPDGIEVAYMRGRYDRYDEVDADIFRAILAITHNNLPRRYCSCDVQTLWYEDDTRPLEPPVRLGLGRSTWGLYYAEQIIREFDHKRNSHGGGLF